MPPWRLLEKTTTTWIWYPTTATAEDGERKRGSCSLNILQQQQPYFSSTALEYRSVEIICAMEKKTTRWSSFSSRDLANQMNQIGRIILLNPQSTAAALFLHHCMMTLFIGGFLLVNDLRAIKGSIHSLTRCVFFSCCCRKLLWFWPPKKETMTLCW